MTQQQVRRDSNILDDHKIQCNQNTQLISSEKKVSTAFLFCVLLKFIKKNYRNIIFIAKRRHHNLDSRVMNDIYARCKQNIKLQKISNPDSFFFR
jgi:hypothetical protein